MRPAATIRFRFDGETLITVDLMPGVRCPRVGEYVCIDQSYHIIDVAHDYSPLEDSDEDDVIGINIHLAEDV